MTAPTHAEIDVARLHATAWENAWDELRRAADRQTTNTEKTHLAALAALAMFVGGSYRKIANGSEIKE